MKNENAKDLWDQAASAYRAKFEGGGDVAWRAILEPSLREALLNVKGLTVLDAGCGHGRLTLEFLRNGANVIAVDFSPAMVRMADELIAAEGFRDCTLVCSRISSMHQIASEAVDVAFALNVLQDLSDLDDSVLEIARVMKPGGRLHLAIEHPFTTSRPSSKIRVEDGGDSSYFRESEYVSHFLGSEFPVIGWHRPVSRYLHALHSAGFEIRQVMEPVPTDRWVEEFRDLSRWQRQPLFLVVEAAKR